jgi:hypothetical protein
MSTIDGGKNIILDKLIYYLDSANSKSYLSGSTTWVNISNQQKNSGTLVNGVTFSNTNKGCLLLDGINDYIGLPQITTNQTFGNYSFSIWFSPSINITSSNTNNYMIIEAQNLLLGGVDNYLHLLSGSSGRISFQTFNPYAIIYTTTNNWVANRWYNLTCTYDILTSVMSLYLNGNLEATTTSLNCYFNTNSYFSLGTYSSPSKTWNLPARINNFMVYTKTLSSFEVRYNYNALKARFNIY